MLRLEFERRRKDLTQEEVGRGARLDRAVVSRLEKGLMQPYPGWKRKLEAFFNLPADVLFREVEIDGELQHSGGHKLA